MTQLHLVEQQTQLRRVTSTRGGEYCGPCPWCGGRDRFRVWPNADKPRYWCRRCEKHGDAIQWLIEREGLIYREACERLNIPLAEPLRMKRPPQLPRLSNTPCPAWQAKAQGFIERCEQALWTPIGDKALAYLHQRGLTDDTLHMAGVGYHAMDTREPRSIWGLEPDGKKAVWLPRGLVFPWYFGKDLWRVVIRRPVKQPSDKDPKYVSVSGSGNTLYRIETVRPNAPAIIVEGVLDAFAIAQEAGDLLAVIAAGSTTGGRLERWIGRLGLASRVLVAFDADEAGEEAATWWLKALGSWAKRWRPYWDDPSAMLQEGVDLRCWIREGLGTNPKWWREVASWPEDRRELWEERAHIMEVEGDLSRDEAEREAFASLQGAPGR